MISQKPTPFGVSILLTYSILLAKEISEVSGARTIAECYLINMFEKFGFYSIIMFCLLFI